MSVQKTIAYDLYIDESGRFLESSSDPVEQDEVRKARRFPSQLAGLLVPRGELTTESASSILRRACAAIGLPFQPVHARELPRLSYDRFVHESLAGVVSQNWQLVRLVNQEQVSYGDRVSTYTNLVAELLLRIYQQKRKEGQSRINLRLIYAVVWLGENPNGESPFIESEEYWWRIDQYLTFLAVRRGMVSDAAKIMVDGIRQGSGANDPELQLCDVVSHASHDNFFPCQPETADRLRAAFGPYDFTLQHRELLERVGQHVADGSFALALIQLAEASADRGLSAPVKRAAQQSTVEVVAKLAELSTPTRNPQLVILTSWIEQIVDVQRSLQLGHQLTEWLLSQVEQPLRKHLENTPDAATLDWFAYALHSWALSISNHRGSLHNARRECKAMKQLVPSLAGHWEHAPHLMRGLVSEAVHLTDCFEHSAASERTRVVAGYYSQLGELFHDVMPDVFPERVRSDLHGRALGTWLQSEILAGLCQNDLARLDVARNLSDQAIDEFPAEADKLRQYQYRSQLETAAGNFAEARRYLARSLNSPQDSHEVLAAAITGLNGSSAVAAGFAQLHWFRLGVTACLDGDQAEGESFLAAVNQAGALDWPWSRADGSTDYPVHGVLRRVAVIRALQGETEGAMDALRQLANLLSGKEANRLVLQTIRLAAHAESATIVASKQPQQAQRILDHSAVDFPGLVQLLGWMKAAAELNFPGIWRVFNDWDLRVVAAIRGDPAALRRLPRRIGY